MPFQRRASWFTCVGDVAGSGSYTLDWIADEKAKKGAVLQESFFVHSLFNKQANKRTEGNQSVQSSSNQTPNESVKQL